MGHDYRRGWGDDGLYHYLGEGPRGDTPLSRGTAAVANHVDDGRDLHVFEQRKRGIVRYVGQMVCVNTTWDEGVNPNGDQRKPIIFHLHPIDLYQHPTQPADPDLSSELQALHAERDLAALRVKALAHPTADPWRHIDPQQVVRIRSEAIKRYAMVRAHGICEGCGHTAPFLTSGDEPFLEIHHIRRLSDGGPDHPLWVAAVCPNCHRRAHYSREASAFNHTLAQAVLTKEEPCFWNTR